MPNETSTKKHLSATVYYLLTGLLLGWPGLFGTGPLLRNWSLGITTTALSLGVIHLLVLGSMLTIAFGVLYQIIPIAFQAPPVPRHVLRWHLPTHIVSVLIMVFGFLQMAYAMVAWGGILLLCNTAVFFAFVATRYVKARNQTGVHKRLLVPFTTLWLVFLIGLFQALFPGQVTGNVLMSHVALGGLAFWGGLVFVFSYKLVPMFAISHGYPVSLNRSSTTYFIGILLVIVSWWIPSTVIHITLNILGACCTLFGLVTFCGDFFGILRVRKRRRMVLPMYDAVVATMMFVFGQFGIIAYLLMGTATPVSSRLLFSAIYLFWFGGLIGLMYAYMQKMVPFLWFEYRFSKRPERRTAPLIDDMVPKSLSQIGIGLYFVGVVCGVATLWIVTPGRHAAPLQWASAGCLTLGSILLFMALLYVLTIGGSRPADTPPPESSANS